MESSTKTSSLQGIFVIRIFAHLSFPSSEYTPSILFLDHLVIIDISKF